MAGNTFTVNVDSREYLCALSMLKIFSHVN